MVAGGDSADGCGVGTSVRPLEAKSCSNCLDIHLSDYNLFLLEDYSGGHVVEGKVAAGGNISMSKFALGEKLSADNLYNAVVAGGTLTLTEGACKGDVYYSSRVTACSCISRGRIHA